MLELRQLGNGFHIIEMVMKDAGFFVLNLAVVCSDDIWPADRFLHGVLSMLNNLWAGRAKKSIDSFHELDADHRGVKDTRKARISSELG